MKTMNTVLPGPEIPELLHRIASYWRAANYLSVGQLYLCDNPLLKKPLELSHVKPLVVGHGGAVSGRPGPSAAMNSSRPMGGCLTPC
jgi:xylulose-5-phosphate/fructose-6-phosphate phosphoketolase